MKHTSLKYILLGAAFTATSTVATAQDGEAGSDPYFFDNLFSNGLAITVAVVVVATLFTLYKLLMAMTKVQQIKIYQEHGLDEYLKEIQEPQPSLWKRLYNRWTDNVPLEKEDEILFDHEFDGISELDNNLPPWWVAMFYITIFIGVVYVGYYHVFKLGPSSKEKYEMEMEKSGGRSGRLSLAKQADQVDESNVTMLEDESELALGPIAVPDQLCFLSR